MKNKARKEIRQKTCFMMVSRFENENPQCCFYQGLRGPFQGIEAVTSSG